MSGIVANADDQQILTGYMPADDFRALLGDSLTSIITVRNIENNTLVGSERVNFRFEGYAYSTTYPVFNYDFDEGDWLYSYGQTFARPRSQNVPILIYSVALPFNSSDMPNYYAAEINTELNISFDNCRHIEFACGYMAYNSSNHVSADYYPRNYLAVDGTAYTAAVLHSNQTLYANFQGSYSFYDSNNNERWIYPRCPQCCYYYDSSTPATFTVNRVHGDGLDWWSGRFWLFFIPPYIDLETVEVPIDAMPTWQQVQKIEQTINDIKVLIQNNGFGGGGLTKNDVIDLFVPTSAQLSVQQANLQALLEDHFGALYESKTMLADAVGSITSEDLTALSTIRLPALTVRGQTIIPAQDVLLKPPQFSDFFELLAVVIDVVCTFALVNGLRRRFERGVLENDG